MSRYELAVDVPGRDWLTANGRDHWAKRASRTRRLRHRAFLLARSALAEGSLAPTSGRVHVDALIVQRTRRRMDPANAYPTVKPLIDGLTDAGVWEDDDADHVDGPDMRLGGVDPSLPAGAHRIILVISTNDGEEVEP